MCAAPKQGQALPAGVDLEKETVITGRVRLSIRCWVFKARISTFKVSLPALNTKPPTPLRPARPTP